MGEVLPFKKPMSESDRNYWFQRLENAERAREYALRQLGMLGVEKGVPEVPDDLYDGYYGDDA